MTFINFDKRREETFVDGIDFTHNDIMYSASVVQNSPDSSPWFVFYYIKKRNVRRVELTLKEFRLLIKRKLEDVT